MLGEILKALKSHKISARNGRVNGTVKLEEILKYIRKHQGANRTEFLGALNISIRSVSRYIKTLSDKIEFRGVPKNWRILSASVIYREPKRERAKYRCTITRFWNLR